MPGVCDLLEVAREFALHLCVYMDRFSLQWF